MEATEPVELVLAINPGSTSTKAAIFSRGERVATLDHSHPPEEISHLPRIADQLALRERSIEDALGPAIERGRLVAVVGRGGLLRAGPGGVYRVGDAMVEDLLSARFGEHASNLGAPLARRVGTRHDVPAYIADPVTTDELLPEARLSGVPEIERRSRAHALNIRACARRAAATLGRDLGSCRFVVAHMGGGISVAALDGGAIRDVNDALLGMGPFSPERAGALPVGPLVELALSGRFSRDELLRKLSRSSGLVGYLGTNDLRVVLRRIEAGDEEAALVLRAMVHQVAKEIGAMATVLRGALDGVILTGGLAHAAPFVAALEERVGFLGRLFLYPGENELESLAAAGFHATDEPGIVQDYAANGPNPTTERKEPSVS